MSLLQVGKKIGISEMSGNLSAFPQKYPHFPLMFILWQRKKKTFTYTEEISLCTSDGVEVNINTALLTICKFQ